MIKVVVFLFVTVVAYGQFDTDILPTLEGDELRELLISEYKPDTVLTLSQTRDTLYAVIYLEDDSVRCVYSGFTKFLDPTLDPSQAMFSNGGTNQDINLEHGYPRGKGAAFGNALSDMHHLFPTRVDVNSARATDPFMEIEDNQTLRWYLGEETFSRIPSTDIDLYGEDINEGFEPREDFKGNVARAMFYFYTMYQFDADIADPDFFELQRETLCQWHYDDPVDSLEWTRTFRIANYQFGQPNPFVLDCSLASRLYCDDVGCKTVSTENIMGVHLVSINPTLLAPYQSIKITTTYPAQSSVSIVDITGRVIASYDILDPITAPSLGGTYYVVITAPSLDRITRKIVVSQ